jgi:DNA invertase Pin-like site-specific DNA recombinase
MARVGYARVSSTGQSLEIQLDKLRAVGCDRIFQEKLSGTTDRRPQLRECLRYLREGDTLIISRLDRLARSTLHLHQIAEHLKQVRELRQRRVAGALIPELMRSYGVSKATVYRALGAA